MARMDSRKACLNCRRRHLKCDREEPSCGQCSHSNFGCDRTHTFRQVRFNEQSKSMGGTNTRAEPEAALGSARSPEQSDRPSHRFIDETSSVVKTHTGHGFSNASNSDDGTAFASLLSEDLWHNLDGDSLQPSNLSPSASYFFNNPPPIIGLPLSASVHHIVPVGETMDTEEPAPDIGSSSVPTTGQESLDPARLRDVATSGARPTSALTGDKGQDHMRETQGDALPVISHPREAYLLKVYTQTWGPIFDCLDADMTFTKSVLHIAMSSFQPLFWAILATSALQLSRVSNYPSSAAKHYRSQCSKSLVPILLQETQSTLNEEALFATYVLLRNYEHMTENLMERHTDGLFTAALAISAYPPDVPSDRTSLGSAAFWVHLRQDIHLALLLEVPINTDYPPCLHREKRLHNLDDIISENISVRPDILDSAWANRIASILVDVINHCFQGGQKDPQAWISLRGKLDRWNISKPDRFQAYYERAPNRLEGRYFPDIWISSDCYVIAWLYYHTAIVLLKRFVPSSGKSPAVSHLRSVNNFESREEILIHARAICGIVRTNPNAQALIVLCHMVTVSAIFFTDEAEQNEITNLLRMAHDITGHPLQAVEQKLRRGWTSGGTSSTA